MAKKLLWIYWEKKAQILNISSWLSPLAYIVPYTYLYQKLYQNLVSSILLFHSANSQCKFHIYVMFCLYTIVFLQAVTKLVNTPSRILNNIQVESWFWVYCYYHQCNNTNFINNLTSSHTLGIAKFSALFSSRVVSSIRDVYTRKF